MLPVVKQKWVCNKQGRFLRVPKVSVIIPVYNAENYLANCLNSVINQSYKNIEIICVDDNSQDNSSNILAEYSLKDKRIKIIKNNNNSGAAISRNTGLDNASGEYIYFIDADDYIDERYIECMVNKIEQKNCDIVFNLSIYSEANGNSIEYKHPSMPEINKEGEYLDNITAIHDAPCFVVIRIYRKSFLDEYKLRFLDTYADDVAFNTITNIYCEKVYGFYGEKYHYIVNTTGMIGMSEKSNCKDLNHIKAYDMIYDYLKEHNKFNNNLKLFRVYPFMKVDTQEKFEFYKKFFEKIKSDFHKNENIYNELEKYFAYSLFNSTSYEEYLKHYNKVVTIGYIRQRGK